MDALSVRHDRDASTGVLTPEAFEKAMDRSADLANKEGGSFSLLAISLDNFGLIEDGFGPESSLQIVKQPAQRLVTCAGAEGNVSQGSGGLFHVVVRGGSSTGIELAGRVKSAFSMPFEVRGDKAYCTGSIGIAVYPEHGAHAKILNNTSLAMRSIKNSGGGDYCIYDPKMAVQARDEALLVNELRLATEAKQFDLYFQPKIDAKSLQVTAAEALLR